MAVHFKQVAIIGVGLIGGSLGMILKRKALADHVVGVGRRIENLKTAVALGAIDRYVADPQEGVRGADLVILATPVDTYERHLREWAHCLAPGAIVSDLANGTPVIFGDTVAVGTYPELAEVARQQPLAGLRAAHDVGLAERGKPGLAKRTRRVEEPTRPGDRYVAGLRKSVSAGPKRLGSSC